jgi:hypothetical protein
MSFFTKASLPHQISHYLTKSKHWVQGLQEMWAYSAARIASLLPGSSGLIWDYIFSFSFPSPS